MSQSVVLACPPAVQTAELSDILKERWPAYHRFTASTPQGVHIQEENGGTSYLSVDELGPADEVTQDYQENDELPSAVREQLSGKKYYVLRFNDERLFMKAFLLMLSRLTPHVDDMWLDNGYGVLIPARTFLEEATRNPAWEWRQFRYPQ